jgi:hypothetical protein
MRPAREAVGEARPACDPAAAGRAGVGGGGLDASTRPRMRGRER